MPAARTKKPSLKIATLALILSTSAGWEAQAENASALSGEWTSNCLPIGKNGRHGYVTRIVVDGASLRATAQLYARNTCETPTVQVRFSGELVDAGADRDGVAIAYIVDEIAMTLHSEDVVAHYNRATDDTGCGYTDWQENVTRPVDGRACGTFTFPARDTRLFDVARIAGNELRFSAFPMIWTADAPDKVPQQPLPIVYYRTVR